jgi:hypothetical protein
MRTVPWSNQYFQANVFWSETRPKIIVTFSGFAWLINFVLDLRIEFIGSLYNLLQHFTNHSLRRNTLDFWPCYTTPLHSWSYSDFQLKYQLYSLGFDTTENTPIVYQWMSFLVAYSLERVYQESVSAGICLSSCCLAMGLYVTVLSSGL